MSPAIANSPKASSLSLQLQGASADTARFPALHVAKVAHEQPVPASRTAFSRPHRISPVENSFPSNSGDYVASSIGALEQSYEQDTVRMFNRIRQARQHSKSSDAMSSMSGAHSHSLADALFLNYSTSETISTMQPVSEIIPPMVKEEEDDSDDSDFIFELDL